MLKVDELHNGVVIDHITAGTGLALYHMLELEKLHDATVALLQNVRSQKTGKKDIIKIEGDVSGLNFDVLGYLDPQITISPYCGWPYRAQGPPRSAQAAGECDPVHQPPLHHRHRGGLRSHLCPDPQRPLPLHLLRGRIPRKTVTNPKRHESGRRVACKGGLTTGFFLPGAEMDCKITQNTVTFYGQNSQPNPLDFSAGIAL